MAAAERLIDPAELDRLTKAGLSKPPSSAR